MAFAASTHPTATDIVRTSDRSGRVTPVIELMEKEAPLVRDGVWKEGNLPTGHLTTQRTALTTPTWRRFNEGSQPTKTRTNQITDTCALISDVSEVDRALLKVNGNTAAFRAQQDRGKIQSIHQEFSATGWYGNADVSLNEFTGIAPRFNSTTADNGENIILADTSPSGGDYTSIYLIIRGDGVHFIYPKGTTAGLSVEDWGLQYMQDVDGSGGRMPAYVTTYEWYCGLAVPNWQHIVRIANIDVSRLTKDASSGADLCDTISRAMELPPQGALMSGKPILYCHRTVKSALRRQITSKVGNSTLSRDMVAGAEVLSIGGVPIHRDDNISITESLVS